jgi:molecular chaperone GrpE (heat shock protein)
MSRYKPTIEEISETRRQREEMSAKVESKKEIYDNLKQICNRDNSTEKDFAALAVARVEWHDAGIENERFIATLYDKK